MCLTRLRDTVVTVAGLLFATLLCGLLRQLALDESILIMVYLATVILVARLTVGYLFGSLASLLAVLLFNFFFTAPYLSFHFYNPKYPLIFAIMLAVSLLVSTMMNQIRRAADERIRLAALQQEKEREIRTEKLRNTMLHSLSHDLRSPLTSLTGSASMLSERLDELSGEERKRLVEGIYEETMWLSQFVENLLNLTRFNENLMCLNRKTEVLDEVVGETARKIRRRLNGRTLRVSTPQEIVMAEMDYTLIEQVLVNLIENAIAHTPPDGEITLTVRAEAMRLIFDVRNNGDAISDKVMDRMFDRYASGDEHRYDMKRGLGLGLHICRTIVKAHGGEITAMNNAEGGATFSFWIPMHGGDVDDSEDSGPDRRG